MVSPIASTPQNPFDELNTTLSRCLHIDASHYDKITKLIHSLLEEIETDPPNALKNRAKLELLICPRLQQLASWQSLPQSSRVLNGLLSETRAYFSKAPITPYNELSTLIDTDPTAFVKNLKALFNQLTNTQDSSLPEISKPDFNKLLLKFMKEHPNCLLENLQTFFIQLSQLSTNIPELTLELFNQIAKDDDYSKQLTTKFCTEVYPYFSNLIATELGASGALSSAYPFIQSLVDLSTATHNITIRRLLSKPIPGVDEGLINHLIGLFTQTSVNSPIYNHIIDFGPLYTDFSHEFITCLNEEQIDQYLRHLFLYKGSNNATIIPILLTNQKYFLSHIGFIFSLGANNSVLENRILFRNVFFKALADAKIDISEVIKLCPEIQESYECYKKSGELCDCIARTKVDGAGYDYTFTLKPEFMSNGIPDDEKIRKRQKEIYPAIEATPSMAISLFDREMLIQVQEQQLKLLAKVPPSDVKQFLQISQELDNIAEDLSSLDLFKVLGYQATQLEMTLPDKDALMYRYNQHRLKHSDKTLPEIDLISSPGIASDITFIQENIAHDSIISDGKEFIHDQFFHIRYVLKRANLGEDQFNEIKAAITARYKDYLRKLTRMTEILKDQPGSGFTLDNFNLLTINFPIFKTLVSALVDTVSNRIDGRSISIMRICLTISWQSYLSKLYNGVNTPTFDTKTMLRLIPLLENL